MPFIKGGPGFTGKHSEETKKKLSLLWKGKKRSLESIKKQIETVIKRGSQKGENNPMWKGGLTPLVIRIRNCFKYRQWRDDVFTRDNWTCQECSKRGREIHAHHINMFSIILYQNSIKTFEDAMNCEELWNINNGITLCQNCHSKYPSRVSKKGVPIKSPQTKI